MSVERVEVEPALPDYTAGARSTTAVPAGGLGQRPLIGLVKLARPWHWVKNLFVLLPVPFGLASGGELHVGPFLFGLLGFCLVNSAVYALNDLLDAEADRRHDSKRFRPVACGDVAPWLALIFSVALFAAGLALCWQAGRSKALAITLVYAAMNVVYCLGGKHVPLLDVFLISAGFVVRVLLGCFLVEVPPSNWLLLCSSALALFLGAAKRRGDLAAGISPDHRPSLAGYDYMFLNQMLGITATVAIMSYCLYSLESPVFLKGRQLASVPFAAYGILHYLRVALMEGAGASPVAMFYNSWTLRLCGIGWFLAVLWSVGKWF
jgi:4-hydroxybenzoate polyprenyltransferase